MPERALLIEAARALGLALHEADAARLLRLLDELARWNRSYNLTAITDRAAMLTHHLLDSLSIHADLHGTRIADVGTGAGFPGLPLALIRPAGQFTLVDSSSKKVRFVAHAARVLALANVSALHARAESMRPPRPFDTVIARAFAPLPRLLGQVRSLCGPGTRVLAMKGRRPDAEIEALPPGWRVVEVRRLDVPRLDGERHLVVVRTADESLPVDCPA